jgi:hypothetical protein
LSGKKLPRKVRKDWCQEEIETFGAKKKRFLAGNIDAKNNIFGGKKIGAKNNIFGGKY